MKLRLKKVYTVSKKADKPRIWLQSICCEAAGFLPGDELFIKINDEKEEVTLQNHPFEMDEDVYTVHVSSRKNKISGRERPLVDTAGSRYSFFDINQKIQVNVFRQGAKGKIIVRPLEYRLFENNTMHTQKDERIRVLSVCAGAGVGSAALQATGYFTPIQEIELEEDSAEVLLQNFPNSVVFNGDLRDCQEVAEVDMAFVTLPCSEFSTLGSQEGNIMNDLVIATAKIIQSSRASVLFFENVPQFYKSQSWESLKSLLHENYPFWNQKEIEAWDFGSIATRKRTYAVAFQDEDRFLEFQFPNPPTVRRKKLKDFLDRSSVQHEWKSVSEWMKSFNSREAWSSRSLELTFVGKEAERINCIPKRYSSHCASNSYVLSEDKQRWRLLSINEIKRILGVPEWFQFCEHTQKIRKFELLGQGVDCRVIKAIANRIAYCFMKVNTATKQVVNRLKQSYCINNNGQLQLLF